MGAADGSAGAARDEAGADAGGTRPVAVPEGNRFPTRAVGPVMQFSLLIVPIVMNAFFLVYALMGLILEGRNLLNWSIEAGPNAPWVCAAVVGYSILAAAFARLRGAGAGHPLVISSLVHSVLAVALTALILATVRT